MLLPRHPIQKETRRYFQRCQWLRSWLVLFSSLKVDVVEEVVHMLRRYWHCSSGSDCLPHSNTDLDLVKIKGNSFFMLIKVIIVKSKKAIVFFILMRVISSPFSFSANVLSLENPPMSECVRKWMDFWDVIILPSGVRAIPMIDIIFVSSVRSSYSHPDLLLITTHPTFSDHTGPQHWTFTFWATTAI